MKNTKSEKQPSIHLVLLNWLFATLHSFPKIWKTILKTDEIKLKLIKVVFFATSEDLPQQTRWWQCDGLGGPGTT